jgi:hypothetical protein
VGSAGTGIALFPIRHGRRTGQKQTLIYYGRPIMRPYSVGGLILIVLGVLVLSVHSVTYFPTDHVVGPLGYFALDMSKPHTIFINPIVGIVALAIGIALMMMARRAHLTALASG